MMVIVMGYTSYATKDASYHVEHYVQNNVSLETITVHRNHIVQNFALETANTIISTIITTITEIAYFGSNKLAPDVNNKHSTANTIKNH